MIYINENSLQFQKKNLKKKTKSAFFRKSQIAWRRSADPQITSSESHQQSCDGKRKLIS
jgi:hypothetical protein